MIKNIQTYLVLLLNIVFCFSFVSLAALYPPPQTISSIVPVNDTIIKRAEWEKLACLGVQCELCPFRCFLPEGSRGICKVRMNVAGKLRTLVYAQPVSVHIDPIEKKPVYHMLPGSRGKQVSFQTDRYER